jgi:hypothetical protein
MSDTLSDTDRPNVKAFMAQVSNLPVPQVLPNNVLTITTVSDIQSCLMFGTRPLAVLVLNPSVAKTFALSLLDRVREYESLLGHEIRSLDELRPRAKEL